MWKQILYAGSVALLALLPHTPAQAQATRTWVSGLGDDAHPCSRTAPCKTFQGAHLRTLAGGIISVLDASGYGPLTITKSISIVAEGVQAGILAGSITGIVINAGPNDVVYLHGLFIDVGSATDGNGIRIVSAGAVHINKCDIRGFLTGNGIRIEANTATKVFVSDCTIAHNAVGVLAAPQSVAEVFLDRVRLVRNQSGIVGLNSKTIFQLSNSILSGNKIAIDHTAGGVFSFRNNALIGNVDDGQGMVPVDLK